MTPHWLQSLLGLASLSNLSAADLATCTPRSTMTDQAFVTLTTNYAYTKGVPARGSPLKQHRTTRRLVVVTTLKVSDSMRNFLETVFDKVIMLDVMDSSDSTHLTLMKRPELGATLAKLHGSSRSIQNVYSSLVLGNIDDLFEREELLAAPDQGWPNCFNSGVF
ncbi:Glycogenin-1, partial [Saguinus oedipus]